MLNPLGRNLTLELFENPRITGQALKISDQAMLSSNRIDTFLRQSLLAKFLSIVHHSLYAQDPKSREAVTLLTNQPRLKQAR